MPKFLEELQLKSLSAVIAPRDGVSIYNSGGVVKILYPDGSEKQLMTGDATGIDFSQYYTKEEVDNLLAGEVGFSIQVVDSLPHIGNPATIYLVPFGDDSENTYTEYIFANGGWEIIGSTAIDLTDYYTKEEIDAKLQNLPSGGGGSGDVNLSNYYTKQETKDVIDTEVSKLLDAAPEAYNTFKEVADYIESDLSNTAAMLASINSKADKSEVYTQVEANAKFASKSEIPSAPDLTKYYTKEETLDVIDKISGLDNYYDMAQVDAKLLNKQDLLISGSNLKTINGESILGFGNIEVAGSGGGSNVIANVELDGGEDILESIQIEDTKYSLQGQDMTFSETKSENPDAKILKTINIDDDDWTVEGSVVKPNVELNGDEDVLESVDIDGIAFTLKGEEMIFSETAVEGATPLKNIQLGDDNWSIGGGSDVDLSDYYTKTEIDNQLLSEITFSEEAKDGYNLKSITVGETVWNVGGVSESYVDQKVAALVNSAPETLDTLGELAAALEENSSLVDTLNTLINQKANKSEVPNIVYSETEPENPVLGMIWLKPVE